MAKAIRIQCPPLIQSKISDDQMVVFFLFMALRLGILGKIGRNGTNETNGINGINGKFPIKL